MGMFHHFLSFIDYTISQLLEIIIYRLINEKKIVAVLVPFKQNNICTV